MDQTWISQEEPSLSNGIYERKKKVIVHHRREKVVQRHRKTPLGEAPVLITEVERTSLSLSLALLCIRLVVGGNRNLEEIANPHLPVFPLALYESPSERVVH